MSVEEDFEPVSEGIVREKILHVLGIFPGLSQSMLQVGIGTAISSKIWIPILDDLILKGKVVINEKTLRTPSGRDQTYRIISLVKPCANCGYDKNAHSDSGLGCDYYTPKE